MSKLGNLDRFQDGPTAARRKHNDVVHTVNYLMRKANEEVIVARAGGRQIRNAYCKTDAGSGSTIVCYLDMDGLNDAETNEVTVTCTLIEATDLDACFPTLKDGTMMPVWKDTSGETAVWRSLWWFQGYEECA